MNLKLTAILIVCFVCLFGWLYSGDSDHEETELGGLLVRSSSSADHGGVALAGAADTVGEVVRVEISNEPREIQRATAGETGEYWLVGQVFDDLEQIVTKGAVEALDRSGELAATSDIDRHGRFKIAVEPGVYEVGVSKQGLALGYEPALKAVTRRLWSQSKFEMQIVEVTTAEPEAELVLHVYKAAHVVGTLFNANHEPIEGAHVFLDYAGTTYQPPTGRGEARTDESGRFEITQRLPGNFRLFIQAPNPELGEFGFEIAPPPVEVVVEGGGIYDLGDLFTGGNDVTVTGRVIDQDGEGLAGALIGCYPFGQEKEGWKKYQLGWTINRTRTGPDGRFALNNLPSSFIRMDLTAGWEKPISERKVATWWKPYYIDLRDQAPGSTYDMGEHFVPASRPYYLTVRFDIDPKWLAKHGIPLSEAGSVVEGVVRAVDFGPSSNGLTKEERYEIFGGGGRDSYDEETATMRYAANPPGYGRDMRVLVTSEERDCEFEDFEVVFTPYQNGSEEMTIKIPPK